MSRTPILVGVGAFIAVAAIIAAVVFTRDDSSHPPASSSERVAIEFRSSPVATIYIDGQKRGDTPMRLQFPKSSRQIVVKAEMVKDFVRRGGTKRETYGDTRTVTLDSDQTLDFTMAKAKLENVEEHGKDETE